MIQGMEHLSCEDRLRAGAVQPREEKAERPDSGLSVSKGELQEKKGTDRKKGEIVSVLKRVDLG